MKLALVCLLALTTGCASLTPREKAIGAAIIVTSIALSVNRSDPNKPIVYNCGECRAVK
jgi:hypothetical protein